MKTRLSIEEIVLSHSTRGMDKLYHDFNTALIAKASRHFYDELKRGRVFIYTGFWANGMGETDGPVGAYFLYKGFEKLGFLPVIITDKYCDDFFPDCEVLYINVGEDTVQNFTHILNEYHPIANFSIERLGRDSSGRYKNAKRKDIGEFTSKLDILYELSSATKYSIGDGGNEIGMGNFQSFFEEYGIDYSSVKSDFPMVASVSNWGAYGFLAYLQKYSKKILLPCFEEVEQYLAFIVSKGAKEGFSGENKMCVDGKGYLVDAEILAQLNEAII